MSKKPPTGKAPSTDSENAKPTSLTAALSRRPAFKHFTAWLVGDMPIITHAWSEKAKREMLSKQVKATKAGREARDPQEDFVNSLYEMTPGVYGFPSTGIKNCLLSAAHKDKGIARTEVLSALWIDADIVRVRPALAGAICDMPLVRIYGSAPENREDMVRVGKGLQKTSTLAYRAQFTVWAIRITGRINTTVLTDESLAFLAEEAGTGYGLGEWRNEKRGVFGAFHLATPEEETAWDAFAFKKGPLPVPVSYRQAAE